MRTTHRDNDYIRPKAVSKDTVFTYKDPKSLRRYMTEQGYILARAKTGLTQKQQRHLTLAVKHARHLALLPFTQTL
jgi:small subunit ribosomal protein S18